MKKAGLADWRTSSGLPSASDPETEADRKPRESLLACMTANREPRLIKALKLTGGRRFAQPSLLVILGDAHNRQQRTYRRLMRRGGSRSILRGCWSANPASAKPGGSRRLSFLQALSTAIDTEKNNSKVAGVITATRLQSSVCRSTVAISI